MEQTGKTPLRDIYRENLGRAFTQYLAPYFPSGKENLRALSVGCSFGYEAEPVVRLGQDIFYRGIDINNRQIAGAIGVNSDLQDRAEFLVADARREQAFGDTPWDLIILRHPQILGSRDLLNNVRIEDWQTIITNCVNFLAKGGVIFTSTEEDDERRAVVASLSAYAGELEIVENLTNQYPTNEGAFRDNFVIIGRKL